MSLKPVSAKLELQREILSMNEKQASELLARLKESPVCEKAESA